jgi:hypothetical protein
MAPGYFLLYCQPPQRDPPLPFEDIASDLFERRFWAARATLSEVPTGPLSVNNSRLVWRVYTPQWRARYTRATFAGIEVRTKEANLQYSTIV